MNTNFNYSGFIEMFLESNDEFESYGVITEGLDLLEQQPDSDRADKYVINQAILNSWD